VVCLVKHRDNFIFSFIFILIRTKIRHTFAEAILEIMESYIFKFIKK